MDICLPSKDASIYYHRHAVFFKERYKDRCLGEKMKK
jgi:hypothetical protein